MMPAVPGRPRMSTRLARALGLDGNPLRRASDRAEAWIRAGLIAVFLIAGPLAAVAAGGWASHSGFAEPGARTVHAHGGQSSPASAVIALAVVALMLWAVLRLAQRFLNRRRLAAWEAAWSAVGPRWTGRRS